MGADVLNTLESNSSITRGDSIRINPIHSYNYKPMRTYAYRRIAIKKIVNTDQTQTPTITITSNVRLDGDCLREYTQRVYPHWNIAYIYYLYIAYWYICVRLFNRPPGIRIGLCEPKSFLFSKMCIYSVRSIGWWVSLNINSFIPRCDEPKANQTEALKNSLDAVIIQCVNDHHVKIDRSHKVYIKKSNLNRTYIRMFYSVSIYRNCQVIANKVILRCGSIVPQI